MSDIKERRSEMRPCCQCGTLRKFFASNLRDGDGKYCSTACAHEGRSNHGAILRALPATPKSIIKKTGVSEGALMRTIERLVKAGRMHAARLVPSSDPPRARLSLFELQFDAGPSPYPDAPMTARDALYWFYDRAILAAMPGSLEDIVFKSGIPQSTVSPHVLKLHKSGGCHIRGWRRPESHHGPFIAVWRAGPGVDAVCKLRAMTDKESRKKRMAKLRKTGEFEEFMQRRRELERGRKLRRVGDPLVNALFGAPRERFQQTGKPRAE